VTRRTVWDDLVGQDKVVSFLRKSSAEGTTTHAYLFVGPPGSGKKSAARALACAMLCDDGGCGTCAVCSRIRRGSYPDVRVYEPEGAATYMVDQAREIIHDTNLSPVEGRLKFYILDRAEAFNPAAANALLKTLEEPPDDVVLVLLTTSWESVLPTIASRCQVVRFAPVSPSTAVALLAERSGVGPDDAMAALAASGGVIPRALEFVSSPVRRLARDRLLGVLRDLPVMDGRDVLEAARELLTNVKAPLDEVRVRQEAELRERVEFLGKTAGSLKPIEDRHKRELTGRERDGIGELVNVAASWLRDVAATSAGAPELVANRDAADDIAAAASCIGQRQLARASNAVAEARRRISYNVSPQLAIEAMLFDIQEAITCPRSWE
jgi:DNA polymerase-3 subunit delta'